MNENMLLTNEAARHLYFDFASKMPIIDYHCHISPAEIAEDKRFDNIAQAWLGGDHYKWRQMRVCGVDERYITGDASDKEKFLAFAEIMPRLIGNPIYTWCALELKRFFGIDEPLSPETAEDIWTKTGEILKTLSVRQMITMSGVKAICTTDDPTDSLEYHRIIRSSGFETKVLPAFRPDKAIAIDKAGFTDYIKKLGNISSFADLVSTLTARLDFFIENGCVAADCGMDYVPFAEYTEDECDAILRDALNGKAVTKEQGDKYKTALLIALFSAFSERGIVCEIHCGVTRNINSRMFASIGADTGFDVIGESSIVGIIPLLNKLDSMGKLPKTIIYSLDPRDNERLLSICGAFTGKGTMAKVQQGSAWWFSDTRRGMENQIKAYSEFSALGTFVGMLTDSRSFLSYTRHEYFRRVLCNYIGTLIENGEYVEDTHTGEMIADICYNNAEKFFGLGK